MWPSWRARSTSSSMPSASPSTSTMARITGNLAPPRAMWMCPSWPAQETSSSIPTTTSARAACYWRPAWSIRPRGVYQLLSFDTDTGEPPLVACRDYRPFDADRNKGEVILTQEECDPKDVRNSHCSVDGSASYALSELKALLLRQFAAVGAHMRVLNLDVSSSDC
eukprot:UN2297